MGSVTRGKWFLLPLPLAILCMGAFAAAGPARDAVLVACILAAKLFALVGFVMAATRFSWGDRLHAAWWLLAFNMVLLLGKDLVFGTAAGLTLGPATGAYEPVRTVMLVVANVASTAATLLLARAFRDTGLDEVAAKPSHRVASMSLVPVAFVVFLAGMHGQIWEWSAGIWHMVLVVVIPNLADFVCFAAIGPIALTAFSLRGGALAWPWALLAVGNAMWLVWDLAATVSTPSGAAVELFRLLALGYTGTAGLEQWWCLRPRAQISAEKRQMGPFDSA